jgi:hypothetical protein
MLDITDCRIGDHAVAFPDVATGRRYAGGGAVGNQASCRVADKAGFAFSAMMPPLPPEFPQEGHLHIRSAGQEVWLPNKLSGPFSAVGRGDPRAS